MSKKSKQKNKRLPSGIGICAMSLAQFSKLHSISRSHLYFLLGKGNGPTIMKAGGRRLISVEAAKEWRRRMETPQPCPANDNPYTPDRAQDTRSISDDEE